MRDRETISKEFIETVLEEHKRLPKGSKVTLEANEFISLISIYTSLLNNYCDLQKYLELKKKFEPDDQPSSR